MDRLTRHELKTDKFVEEVGQTVHFLEEHRQAVIRYGSIVLAVLIVAGAGYAWMRAKKAERQSALAAVLETYNAPVMDPPPAEFKAFRTEQEKNDAIVKGCNELIRKYAGSDEAAVASYLLGAHAADQGDLAAAERYLKEAADDASREYASLAKFSLAQLYTLQNRTGDAERLLRELAQKPTDAGHERAGRARAGPGADEDRVRRGGAQTRRAARQPAGRGGTHLGHAAGAASSRQGS